MSALPAPYATASAATLWPPVTALPGLLLRAVGRVLWLLAAGAGRWAGQPQNRRRLKVLPFVLLGHLLLVWLLVQNRWIVMSPNTVTFMPPIMASIVLSQASASKAGNGARADRAAPWGKSTDGGSDDQANLKPTKELSLGSPRVQRSVPWLITELLPELRGNSPDPKTARRQPVEKPVDLAAAPAAERQAAPPRAKSRSAAPPKPAQAVKRDVPRDVEVLTLPPPLNAQSVTSPLALIPPPPSLRDLPLMPVPAAPTVAEVRPLPNLPSIPDPVRNGPRDIPSLWSPNAAPPPTLVLISPPPPVLKAIPTTLPPGMAPEPTVAATLPPLPAEPQSLPQSPPQAQPAAIAQEPAAPAAPRAVAKAAPAPVTVAAPTPTPAPAVPAAPVLPPPVLAAMPPLTLTPSPALPTAAPSEAAGARNPMVVEVPRYRLAEPPLNAPAGPGSGNAAAKSDPQSGEASSSRSGPEGAGSTSGSVLGLGVANPAANPAPAPLPVASAPTAQGKSLRLNLPKVEVYRSGIGPVRQPSLSDLANVQLRRNTPKDPMAEAVNTAENPDCVKPDKDSPVGGLLAAPVMAFKAMTGKCK